MIDLNIGSYRRGHIDDKSTFNTKVKNSDVETACSFPSVKEKINAQNLRVQCKSPDQNAKNHKNSKHVNVGTPTKSSNVGIEIDDHPTSTMRYNVLTGNRKKVINILRSCNYLNNIQLKPVSSRRILAAEKEVSFDRVRINGINFFSGQKSHNGLRFLRDICSKLCMPEAVEEIYEKIILSLSRHVAYMDCIQAQKTVDLFPLTLIKYAESPRTPIDVDIFLACDCVQANICMPIMYGLYRQNDMEEIERLKKSYTTDKRVHDPWIVVAARVEEKVNFTTGLQIRSLKSTIS